MKRNGYRGLIFLIAAVFLFAAPAQPVLGLTGSDSSSSNSDTTWEYHPDRIILTFNENVTKKEVSEILEQEDMQPILFSGSDRITTPVDLPKELTPEEALRLMNQKKEIAAAQPDYCHRYDGYTNDTEISSAKYSSNQNKYHYIFKLGLAGPGKTAWDYATGKGVNVAVIDGGANVSHLDLAANVKGCYNAVTEKEGKASVPPLGSHGTATAGILAAVGNNKRLSAGSAYNANLYVINAFQELEDENGKFYGAYDSDIMRGIQWAAGKNCRVVSMSLSGNGEPNEAMESMIRQYYSQKSNSILFVSSGGNSKINEYRYPASYDGVLSISAVNYASGKYTISPNSTYNNRIDLAAPGNGLYTLSHSSNTAAITAGATSAATPYVAGIAALVFQANPSLTAAQCAQILTSTATDAGTRGYDVHYGYGVINPLKAVQKAIYKTDSKTQQISGVSSSYKKAYTASSFTLKPILSGSGVAYYQSSNSNIASISSSGKVNPKKIGETTITISVPASGIFRSASKKIALTVTPKTGKIRSAKNIKSRKLKVKWSRDRKASGYQIKLAKNKRFKKAKTYWARKNSTTSRTLAKFKKGKRYYIKIRAYKKSGGKKIYGSYSKVKQIKIRR